ncbi:hypothetical protein ACIA6T_34195 [Streptomyces sp. NPDC051740]|uniref:hypothetical protein n=1 Tax=Streptomyces sp. NPDC051740 TaxID=3365673 RepID=UPI0037A77306
MDEWREDTQPERYEGASAIEKNAGDEDLRETRVLPLREKPADTDVRDAGPGSLEDRWARLGVFPSGNDKTQALPDTAHRAEPPARPGPRADDTRGPAAPGRTAPSGGRPDASWNAGRPAAPGRTTPSESPADGPRGAGRPAASAPGRPDASWNAGRPAAPGRTTPSESPADVPWDTERTTALRVPRQPGGDPGAKPTDLFSRPGGAHSSGDRGATGSPSASRRPSSAPGAAGFPPASGGPSSDAGTAVFPAASGRPSSAPGAADAPTEFLRPSSDTGAPTEFLTPSSDSGAPTEFLRPSSGPGAPTASRAPVRDPWQEEAGDSAAATHDPHEVTVQLDSVQIGEGLELRRAPGRAGGGGQDAAAGPVFVDESGRRSRLYRRIGLAVGLACAGYAVVMVATLLSGNSDAPWMPVPGQEDKPAGQVETTPQPTGTDATPGSGAGLAPSGTPTTGTPTLPAPDTTAPATGGGTGTGNQPDTTDPTPPTTGQNSTNPAAGGDGTTSTPSDDTVSTPPADQPVSETPDPVTTAPTVGGEAGGTDNLAGAPADQPVVADDGSAAQPEPSTTPAAQSPENVV